MAYLDQTNPIQKAPIQKQARSHKVEKLDDAFLFSLSIIGLLIPIIQLLRNNEIVSLVQIIPLLILGVGLPFYVGYIRGAINDSLIDRLRGWIFLIVGVNTYFAFLLFTSIAGVLSLLSFAFGFVAFASIENTEKWFKASFGFEETPRTLLAFSGTVFSSLILAYGLVFLGVFENPIGYPAFVFSVFVFWAFLLVCVSEKMCREIETGNIVITRNKIDSDVQEYPKFLRFSIMIALLAMKVAVSGLAEAASVKIVKGKYVLKSIYLFGITFIFLLLSFVFASSVWYSESLSVTFFVITGIFSTFSFIPFFMSKTIGMKKLNDLF
jgi:hypothetical protein